MFKDFELLKKQLTELSQALNGFKSEAVQLRIVELLFKSRGLDDIEVEEPSNDSSSKLTGGRRRRIVASKTRDGSASQKKVSKPKGSGGATDVLRELVADGYFNSPKQIGEIGDHCRVKLAKVFKANELSPGLLKLVRDKVLDRDKDKETNQFKYRKK